MAEEQITYLGLDLGGTKLSIGLINRQGKILYSKSVLSGPLTQTQAMELMEQELAAFFEDPPVQCAPKAIGIGLVGRINSREGRWMEIDRDRGEGTLAVAEKITQRFGLPCFIDNDVRSAAKAEMLFGRGQNSQNWIYINVGTGIAAGIVTGGRLITGGHWNAGEVGHTASGIELHVPCSCGRPDCVETVASGSGIDRCARALAEKYPDTKLTIPEEGRVSAAEVFTLCESDPLCAVLTDNAVRALANLIMNLVRFCDPDTVILGGGVVADGFLLSKTLPLLDPHTVRFVTNGIVLTELDPRNIGLTGACSNAMIGMEEAK